MNSDDSEITRLRQRPSEPGPMTPPEAEIDSAHMAAMFDWLNAVKSTLGVGDALTLTVDAAEMPGAIKVAVAPDLKGIEITKSLIELANPRLALVVPASNGSSFRLLLHGEQDRLSIHCGPPLLPPEREISYEELDTDERERITQQLIAVVNDLFAEDPDWHPFAAVINPDSLLEHYVTEHPAEDPATVRAVAGHPHTLADLLESLDKQRQSEHERAWVANAPVIAQELLDGDDGDTLRHTTQQNRVRLVRAHLHRLDEYCDERSAAEVIAKAIGVISRRSRTSSTRTKPSGFNRENSRPLKLSNPAGTG